LAFPRCRRWHGPWRAKRSAALTRYLCRNFIASIFRRN
jgi:hypothetical protein